MFQKEIQIIEKFKNHLTNNSTPFDFSEIAFEFNYINGRVDLIGSNSFGELFAFEAKLAKWRIALNQAYRNSSFAHYSYILLPSCKIYLALKNSNEFTRRGIGLCSINQDIIRIEIEAPKNDPLQPWLTSSALNYIEST